MTKSSRCAEPTNTISDQSSYTTVSDEGDARRLRRMEEAMDNLRVMCAQENDAYAPCPDYLSSSNFRAGEGSEVVSEAWRRKLCEWCFEVVDHFGFDREAVAVALNYLDRSVAAKMESGNASIGKREFQQHAVTSLYMALKIHGETDDPNGPRRKLRIDAFVELSRGFFQVDVIEATENVILSSLNWRVNPPTCLRFVAGYLRMCPKWSAYDDQVTHTHFMGAIYDVARYLTELSVCVSTFTFTWKTSVIAYASILCGIEVLQSTFPIPYEARIGLQNNIATATGLVPNNAEILQVRELLKDLCPDMFKSNEVPVELMADHESQLEYCQDSSQDSGKTSPVCVVDEPNEYSRKRSRSSAVGTGQSRLHRSNF